MDLGPDAADHDDLIQRHGRRLFVLAYHLTGDATRAAELTQECLVRSLLAPDFPSTDREAGVFLYRGLISLWRERAGPPGRVPPLRAAGPAGFGTAAVDEAGAGPARAPGAHAALWRALSRLDPVSRAVLVLRVAEGLEYETIGKVLDMAPDIVYARLLQARGGLREGERALEASLFETMNLYLDGRLPGNQQGAFERRLQTDAALRERVEFHRGLTLELHEEAPALPRDFAARLRERLDRAQETLMLVDQAARSAGWEPAAQPVRPGAPARGGRRLSLWAAGLVGALVLLVVGVALGHWAAGRRAPPGPGPGRAGAPANPGTTPDVATIEALRSLGYLAPGKQKSKVKTGGSKPAFPSAPGAAGSAASAPAAKRSPGPSPRSGGPAAPAASPSIIPPSASPSPPEISPAAASTAPVGAATAAPSPAGAPPAETTVVWRVVPLMKALDPGRDRQVIRTPQEWAALFEETGAPPPEIAFDREMAVLLRDDAAGDPPGRLVVGAVKTTSEALWIECRKEPSGPGAEPPSAGQAVVVPISDLPVRFIVR